MKIFACEHETVVELRIALLPLLFAQRLVVFLSQVMMVVIVSEMMPITLLLLLLMLLLLMMMMLVTTVFPCHYFSDDGGSLRSKLRCCRRGSTAGNHSHEQYSMFLILIRHPRFSFSSSDYVHLCLN